MPPDTTGAPGKSAENRARAAIGSVEAAEIVARVIWAAFPAPSAHGVALRAAPALGCSVETVERMLAKRTRHPSAALFLRACAYCVARGVDPLALAGVSRVLNGLEAECGVD